jgi:UDP-glucose 4-epimerase
VRDFVHVQDVSDAHVAAVARLEAEPATAAVYNVGRGAGYSVAQVLAVVAAVTGRGTRPTVAGRRPGDPACVVASAAAIRRDLGWSAQRDVSDMVGSAWRAWQEGADRGRPRIPA